MSLILDGTNGLSDIDGSAATPAIRGTDANTGIFFPAADTIAFAEGGAEAMRIDSSGNLGLGVTPSVAGAGKTFEIGTAVGNLIRAAGQNDMNVESNTIYNSGFKYANNGYANRFGVGAATGQFQWYTAPSGTAGNAITFTETMKLAQDGNNTYVNFGCTGLADAVQLYTGFSSTSSFFAIGTKNSGTLAERARITSAGSLGLGTSNPTFDDGTGMQISRTGVATYRATNTTGNISLEMKATGSLVSIASRGSYPLIFEINGAEVSRFDSSGNLLVGTTSLVSAGKIEIAATAASNQGLNIKDTSGSNNLTYCAFFNSSGTVAGTITHTGSTTVAYNTSSDYRLKENITPMTGALNTVAQLKPVTYKWKEDQTAGQGFIAHELQAVVPDCVTGAKDALDEDGKPVYQGVDV
jgi:hypothetical protein